MKKLFFAFMAVFLFFSCSKDEQFVQNENSPISFRESLTMSDQRNTIDKSPDTITQTVLGGVLNNPFTVENLQRALDSLCDDSENSRIQIRTTDRQIKFTPNDYDEVKRLFRDTSLILFDFPLNREIIEMGDYYIDPETGEDFPDYYSIVPIGQELPSGIPHEVIEEYDYEIGNPLLIAESFRLTDNFEHVNDYIFPEDIEDEIEICGIIIMIPPDDIDCPPPCVPVLVIDDSQIGPGGRPVYKWECDCSGGGDDGNGSGPPINDCGCPTYSDIRKPAGCVNVENNSTGTLDGVRKVEVILKDSYFGKVHDDIWTNDDGCWKYNRRFKGSLYMWVKFVNEDSYIRCWKGGWKVTELLKPVKDYVGRIWGPNFSNIVDPVYWHWGTVTETQAQRYWGAATVNNEVQIFWEEAGDVGLPPFLDIYLQPTRADGAAIMCTYWPNAVVSELMPDLSIGIDFQTRNGQDRLSYHEIGHASHFNQVGFEWWERLMIQEINNIVDLGITPDGITFTFNGNPNGTGNEPDAGYVALAESWADNMRGDMRGDDQEGWIFEDGFIPRGIYHDLEDEDDTPIETVRGIDDRVSGFTRGILFNSLNSNVTTVDQYRLDLQGSLPTGNTLVDYNNLFLAYTP